MGDVAEGATVVIDCLTLWVANLVETGIGNEAVGEVAAAVAARGFARTGTVIAISNEVGSGIVPGDAGSRATGTCSARSTRRLPGTRPKRSSSSPAAYWHCNRRR